MSAQMAEPLPDFLAHLASAQKISSKEDLLRVLRWEIVPALKEGLIRLKNAEEILKSMGVEAYLVYDDCAVTQRWGNITHVYAVDVILVPEFLVALVAQVHLWRSYDGLWEEYQEIEVREYSTEKEFKEDFEYELSIIGSDC